MKNKRKKYPWTAGLIMLAGLALVLYIFPYYAPWYRLVFGLLTPAVLLIGLGLVIFRLAARPGRGKPARSIAVHLALGVILLVAAREIYGWRMQLTDFTIQRQYCQADQEPFKGSLRGGLIHSGGVYSLKDHSPIPACRELYYCSDTEPEPPPLERRWLVFRCLE